ncbi:MAG: branched-chain amino acid transport system II carrier protein [Alphaproteobacteria bacterium]
MTTHLRIVLTAGFAMFSMFFGSGNLVFPLQLGKIAGDDYGVAFLGLMVTAVLVPFLGLLAMILFAGNREAFFATIGRKPAFVLTAIMLALIGPFGVVPRCITVAYGSVKVAFPDFPFIVFCFLFSCAVGALIWQKNRVVEIIGVFLTPWKLGGIIVLIAAGILTGSTPMPSTEALSTSFMHGISLGYQTMDLIAAFFFSAAIVHYLRNHLASKIPQQNMNRTLIKLSLGASLIGATLLVIIYAGFVIMGAKHSVQFAGAQPEEFLSLIAHYSLGSAATVIVCLTLTVACLATAVILTELVVEFLEEDVMPNRITHGQAVILTLAITFAVSLLGFSIIAQGLKAILGYAYPALIIFTLMSIFDKTTGKQWAGKCFWVTIGLFGLYAVWGSYN